MTPQQKAAFDRIIKKSTYRLPEYSSIVQVFDIMTAAYNLALEQAIKNVSTKQQCSDQSCSGCFMKCCSPKIVINQQSILDLKIV